MFYAAKTGSILFSGLGAHNAAQSSWHRVQLHSADWRLIRTLGSPCVIALARMQTGNVFHQQTPRLIYSEPLVRNYKSCSKNKNRSHWDHFETVPQTHPVYSPGQSRWSWSVYRSCPHRRCSPAWGPGGRCSACERTACPPGSAACSGRWWAPCARSCRPRCVRRAPRLQYWAEETRETNTTVTVYWYFYK